MLLRRLSRSGSEPIPAPPVRGTMPEPAAPDTTPPKKLCASAPDVYRARIAICALRAAASPTTLCEALSWARATHACWPLHDTAAAAVVGAWAL